MARPTTELLEAIEEAASRGDTAEVARLAVALGEAEQEAEAMAAAERRTRETIRVLDRVSSAYRGLGRVGCAGWVEIYRRELAPTVPWLDMVWVNATRANQEAPHLVEGLKQLGAWNHRHPLPGAPRRWWWWVVPRETIEAAPRYWGDSWDARASLLRMMDAAPRRP